jgi:cell division initiation protein
MDAAPPSTSVLDTLRTVEFKLGLKGYNVDEVDEFLEKAAVEAEALKEQMRQSVERLRSANEHMAQLEQERPPAGEAVPEQPPPEPAGAAVSDDTLQRTLLLAQRFVEQTKRESENDASEILARAEEQAHVIVSQAEDRARQLSADSEHRLRAEVARLEATRSQLAADVESLGRHLESERARLRGSLSEMLKWIEEKVQPSASLMTLRQRLSDLPRPEGVSDRGGSRAGGRDSANGDRGAGGRREAGEPRSASSSDSLDAPRRMPDGD